MLTLTLALRLCKSGGGVDDQMPVDAAPPVDQGPQHELTSLQLGTADQTGKSEAGPFNYSQLSEVGFNDTSTRKSALEYPVHLCAKPP